MKRWKKEGGRKEEEGGREESLRINQPVVMLICRNTEPPPFLAGVHMVEIILKKGSE